MARGKRAGGGRLPRTRSKPTLPQVRMTIVCGPHTSDVLSCHAELRLAKAAVLYADRIELISPTNQAMAQVAAWLKSPRRAIVDLLEFIPESVFRDGTGSSREEFRRQFVMTQPLTKSDPSWSAIVGEADEAVRTMLRESGAAELDTAGRFVTINDKADFSDTDHWMETFSSLLIDRLQDSGRLLLLDDSMSSFVQALGDAGVVSVSPRVRSNAVEALLSTGFVTRLPAFVDPPMDELLDLRQDLEGPLSRYRRGIARLRSADLDPFNPDRHDQVDALWRGEVEPALQDIGVAMADHGLVREVLRTVGTDPKTLLVAPASIVGLDWVSLHAGWASTLHEAILGALTLAPSLITATTKRHDSFAEVRTHDLFYLHEVNHRL